MKKVTLETIYNTLKTMDYDADILAELETEINRGATEKAQRMAGYEDVREIILNALTDTPATCTEIFDAIENQLPEGFTRGKVQYALTHLWQDEIVKVAGKPNGYKRV